MDDGRPGIKKFANGQSFVRLPDPEPVVLNPDLDSIDCHAVDQISQFQSQIRLVSVELGVLSPLEFLLIGIYGNGLTNHSIFSR